MITRTQSFETFETFDSFGPFPFWDGPNGFTAESRNSHWLNCCRIGTDLRERSHADLDGTPPPYVLAASTRLGV